MYILLDNNKVVCASATLINNIVLSSTQLMIETEGEVSIGQDYNPEFGVFSSASPTSEDEYKWAASILTNNTIETQINYINDEDERASGTLADWVVYRRALRDYAHYDKDINTYSTSDVGGITYTYNKVDYLAVVDSETGRPLSPIEQLEAE